MTVYYIHLEDEHGQLIGVDGPHTIDSAIPMMQQYKRRNGKPWAWLRCKTVLRAAA